MGLSSIRLGDYIKRSTENNSDLKYGEELIKGVNSSGVFASPKGSTLEVDLKPYKIVNNEAFVYNPTRLNLGSLAYRTEGLCIVSHLYIIFYLTDEGKKIINPQWLYIYFHRNEFKREVTFRNFGSQRPEFNFNDMSDITVPLPDIKTQQKYVDVYNAMVANQKAYERGLEDLKLTCDAYIEDLRRQIPCERIGKYLIETKQKNENAEILPNRSVSNKKVFVDAKEAIVNGVDTKNYLVVESYDFAYNTVTTRNADKLSIALNTSEKCLVSPLYTTFRVAKEGLLPEYLCLWFNRSEYDRHARFESWGSARELYPFDTLADTKIPIPDVPIQQSIVNILTVYNTRKAINEKLKSQIKDICPILIKGSIEEGKNAKEA